ANPRDRRRNPAATSLPQRSCVFRWPTAPARRVPRIARAQSLRRASRAGALDAGAPRHRSEGSALGIRRRAARANRGARDREVALPGVPFEDRRRAAARGGRHSARRARCARTGPVVPSVLQRAVTVVRTRASIPQARAQDSKAVTVELALEAAGPHDQRALVVVAVVSGAHRDGRETILAVEPLRDRVALA